MPTFVVSLFLPYTINFKDLPSTSQRPQLPPRLASKADSTVDVPEQKATLFPVPTPPQTPASATSLKEFFPLTPSNAAIHFLKPNDPRPLVRSDAHVPDWGASAFLFNQPRSRAGPPPPDTILEYTKAQGKLAQDNLNIVRRARRSTKSTPRSSRDPSYDGSRWSSNWTVEPAVQGNGGLTNAVRAAVDAGTIDDVFWMGTLGFPTDSLSESKKDEMYEKLETEFDAVPVFVSDSDLDGHYSHYCKTILWPVFNYQIPDHPKSKAYEDHSWIFYVNLNKAFADKIIASYKRGDTIWIHDYHLLLVPGMVREKLPDAQIGFFLHTAFPSSEVFRCLATRKELLNGMLGANLVAFQIREYAHHFMQTCSRLLNVEALEDGVQLENTFVNVTWLPIGIYPDGLSSGREDEDVAHWVKVMQERYQGKKLIVARDKLDNIRGVRQKLLAFELFLNKYPEWKEKVVLIQVATSTTENSELAATVSDIVTRIDSTHSTLAHQPLVFLKQDIAFSQYLALLSVADVLMITSLREGMNLTAHEYVFCQDGEASEKKHGPMVLSEFTGSAAVFEGNELSVNPWDYHQCAKAICRALEMGAAEKKRRWKNMYNIVSRRTGVYWCTQLNVQLEKVYEEHYKRDSMSIPRLKVDLLCEKYRRATRRLFILDYEGTLATHGSPTAVVVTSNQRMLDVLADLTADERNTVYVMSGCPADELEFTFDRLPSHRLGFIAENGCFVREAGADDWLTFPDLDATATWKGAVREILRYYHERIEGSAIEERRCSVIFHHAGAEDREAATRNAADAANHINDACRSQRVRAVPTKDTVIVEPADCDKSTATTHIFAQMSGQKAGAPDFVFVAGNDRDDEVVFRWANGVAERSGGATEVASVSVGRRNTEATSSLNQGTRALLGALQRLARADSRTTP